MLKVFMLGLENVMRNNLLFVIVAEITNSLFLLLETVHLSYNIA